MSRLDFRLEAECPGTKARAATFTTLHGEVKTPIFMPVGTQATVKTQSVETLASAGSNVLLANTYHLLLRPGPEVFRTFGGIHRFMNWQGPVLTDSGGFQIFSLPHSRNMTEEGALFQSYVDGSMILLSPELSIATQRAINSDIMMVLDQCVPSTVPWAEARTAMELTHRWAARSLKARGDSAQSMFGIVQGACYPDLRKQSADHLTQMPFDGFAIGGLAVGEGKDQRNDFCELTAAMLPRHLPRYLMGVGTPLDLLEAVHRGVDMFDCIMPVEQAQRGVAFTTRGKFQLRRTVYKHAEEALDPACPCPTCASYSRAYLHHLTKTTEVLGWQLISTHNLWFYHRLMADMRAHILAGTFASFHAAMRIELDRDDEEHPPQHRHRTPRAERRKHLGNFELVENPGGWWSVRQISSGETMHSVSNPLEEAKRLYVDQPRLVERLGDHLASREVNGSPKGPFVVWDVGLGAATNAMVAIKAVEDAVLAGLVTVAGTGLDSCGPGPAGPLLEIHSFENDLDALRLALRHSGRFPHLYHSAPRALVNEGRWISEDGTILWMLHEGDFLERYPEAPVPDMIWYDPFSAKADTGLWTEKVFSDLGSWLKARGTVCRLYTYTNSTAVRTAMLLGGFMVGSGWATGPKSETTRAWTGLETMEAASRGLDPEERESLLGPAWLDRRSRSHHRYPEHLPETDREAHDLRVLSCPQFSPPL